MKAFRFLAVLMLVCILPFNAFAMDTEFENYGNNWFKDRGSEPKLLYPTDEDRYDYYYYYVDSINKCFYMKLSCDTTDLLKDDSVTDIYLYFETNEDSFSIDKNGWREKEIYKAELYQNFNEYSGIDIYIGIDFSKSEYKNKNSTLHIELWLNNNFACTIPESIPLDFGGVEATTTTTTTATTKPTTTKHTTSDKTTTESKTTERATTEPTATTERATSAAGEASSKTTTEKTTKETTTKFKYTGTVTLTTSNENTQTVTSASTDKYDQNTASASTSNSTQSATSAATSNATQTTTSVSSTKFTYSTAANNGQGESGNSANNDNSTSDETNWVYNTEESLGSGITLAEDEYQGDQTDNTDIIIPETQSNNLSPRAKLLIAFAVILAVCGMAIIFHGVAKKEKEENEESEKEEENEEA